MVEYAGARWRVQRALGVEAILLRSEAGEEVSADPLQIRLPEATAPPGASPALVDELRYTDADWTEATRRRDLLATLASKPSRTTADVAATAATLGVTPRRVWTLLRRLQMHGNEIAPFLPARRGARAKRLSASSEAIIEQAIDQHYAKPARPSLQCRTAMAAAPNFGRDQWVDLYRLHWRFAFASALWTDFAVTAAL